MWTNAPSLPEITDTTVALCHWDVSTRCSLVPAHPPMRPFPLIVMGCHTAPWPLSTLFLGLDGLKNEITNKANLSFPFLKVAFGVFGSCGALHLWRRNLSPAWLWRQLWVGFGVSAEAIVLEAISPYVWQLCLHLAAQDKQPCLQTTPSQSSLWILLQMTGHLCVSRASDFCCP